MTDPKAPSRLLPGLAILLGAVCLLVASQIKAAGEPAPAAFENWKTDFSTTSIDLREVISGGPPKDGIPAIDDPRFVSVAEADLAPRDPVIAFEHEGDARAYPLSILMWHEIANDVVGGHPFAVTYCPLCNAAIVFDAKLDGEILDFGTTGRLRNSDLLMYDRQSESWWQQFTGEAVIGTKTGAQLRIVPSRLEGFASFAERHPRGQVLVPSNPGLRDYGRNPYVSYDSRNAPYPLYTGTLPEGIDPMERVVVLRSENEAVAAVTMAEIARRGRMELAGFRLEWREGRASALDSASISNGREIGNLVASDRDGRDVVHDITFAFVLHAFEPELEIAGIRGDGRQDD